MLLPVLVLLILLLVAVFRVLLLLIIGCFWFRGCAAGGCSMGAEGGCAADGCSMGAENGRDDIAAEGISRRCGTVDSLTWPVVGGESMG